MANIQEKQIATSREEKNGITQELVKKYFDYKDGFLYWKELNVHNRKTKIGDRAGYLSKNTGRYRLTVNAKAYITSRIIFLYHHGYVPEEVDHIDRNSLNDRIENLREATRAENNRNTCSRKNSSSQYLGVSFKTKKYKYISKTTQELIIYPISRWYARIQYDKIQKEIGTFKTEKEAVLAYNREAVRRFGEFANLNIIKP